MKLSKIGFLLAIIIILNSCASGYKIIDPNKLNYNSIDKKNGISLEYKYDLLNKKYAKKETKRGVKVVAIKITNNSDNDIVFGKDFKLAYENDSELIIMDNERVFTSLKQNSATYLLYLLLTPMTLNKTTTTGNRIETSSTPIGYVIGPGLALGNMIAAGSANTKFKNELLDFNLNGVTIKKGETKSGLIGIKSDSYDAIKIKQ
jgi:hypothetical protein